MNYNKMIKSIILLYIYSIVSSYASDVPFIDPCKWDDKKCLIASSQKALPYVVNGIANLAVSPLDPVYLDPATINKGGLNIELKNMKAERLKECRIIDVERNIVDQWLSIKLECPINIKGDYTASGKLFASDIVGDGPFYIKSEKLLLFAKIGLKTVNNHWKLGKYEYTYDFIEKASLDFKNLFGGDKEKAAPVMAIINNQWKELIKIFGGPVVDQAVKKILLNIGKLTEKVSANELEL